MLCQLLNGGGQQVAAGAGGDVIENDGLVHIVCNGAEVGQQAAVQGLIVVIVGSDHQQGICANPAGGLAVFQCVEGVVGAGACNHRDAAIHPLHGETDDFVALGGGQGCALAGGAYGDQGVDAAFQLKVNQPPQGFIVHAGRGHRGCQRSGNTLKNGVVFHNIFSFYL